MWTNKALLLRQPGQFAAKRDLIKFDERGTGRQEGEDGDWVDRRAERNKFEFAKDLMEGILKRNSGRGMRMTFCQRRKGTRRTGYRAEHVIGGRDLRSGSPGMTGCRQEKRMSRKGTNQVLLSGGWHLRTPAHKHLDMYSSRPVSAASSLPLSFSPPGYST